MFMKGRERFKRFGRAQRNVVITLLNLFEQAGLLLRGSAL
jgi:hypothetical protein